MLIGISSVYSQTEGINYQALILNSDEVQIPGTNVSRYKIPLTLEEVSFKFTITQGNSTELYSELQRTVTDENGMVSLIVGEGEPIYSLFENIVWDGTLKYLNVEIDILSQDEGFVFLDTQKILWLPQTIEVTNLFIAPKTGDLSNIDNQVGEIAWVADFDSNGNGSLVIWDGTSWVPVQKDFDPTNELGLVVANDASVRDTLFPVPAIGDQVWNRDCGCIQVFDGIQWLVIDESVAAESGLHVLNNNVRLGGNLTTPTTIETSAGNTLAITNLQKSTLADDEVLVTEKTTGIIRKKALSDLVQEEVVLIVANDGQTQFNTPLPITNYKKINVYRNGVRIDFSQINTATIEIEAEATCYQGDEIRIIQFF